MRKVAGLDCIMLIDDSKATNFVHKKTIEQAGIDCHVEICLSMQEGIDYLTGSGKYAKKGPYAQPGIIFLDIHMPDYTGWDFLDAYREAASGST